MTIMLETEQMLARVEDGIGWMTFNRPERRNALSGEMQRVIPAILETFQADPDVRVVVMRGAGDKAFVSGADIGEFGRERGMPRRDGGDDGRPRDGFALLEKPLIAMIRGYALGAGLLTALRADIRITAEDGRFGIPAARLGLGYGFESTKAIVDAVGKTADEAKKIFDDVMAAAEILLTGRQFSAEEALRLGLVSRVVPVDQLEPTVRELASTIAENAPLTVRLVRESIRQSMLEPEERDMERVRAMAVDCAESDDFLEGRKAFAEKRRPQFTGR